MSGQKKSAYAIFRRTPKPKKDGSIGKPYLSIRFKAPDGSIVKTVALDTNNRTTAVKEAERLLREGVVPNDDNPRAIDYIEAFWRPDSAYVLGRIARGVSMSASYIERSRVYGLQVFKGALGSSTMQDISERKIEAALLKAAGDRGGRMANLALQAITVPINYWAKQHKITSPVAGIRKVADQAAERGILSLQELQAIIDIKDESPRIYAAVLLAALCGLRLGEVRGLQWEDVDEERGVLKVRHNVPSGSYDLTVPKWGSARVVPMPKAVLDAVQVVRGLPGALSTFVLFNEVTPARPMEGKAITDGFKRMLRRIGIDESTRKNRRISLHSLRHGFVSLSRAAGISDILTMSAAGHRSEEMMHRYSHADIIDFDDARKRIEGQLTKKPEEAAREETGGA